MRPSFPVFFIGSIILFCALTWLFPALQFYLWVEDGVVESLGAIFFLTAAIVSLYLLLTKRYSHLGKRMLQCNALLGFIAFLDELSFGERLFGFQVPQFYGITLDAVHDLLEISIQPLSNRLGHTASRFLFALSGVLLLVLAVLYRNRQLRGRPHLLSAFNHVFYCAGLVFAASFVDLHIIRFKSVGMLEELFEMNAGMALVYSGLYVRRDFLVTQKAPKKQELAGKHESIPV